MLTNSLAIGKVWHKRYTPKIHEFQYNLNSWLIDIDNYQNICQVNRFIGIDKFNVYTFDEQKYLRNHQGNLSQKVRQKFIELGASVHDHDNIFLLGQLKNLGLYFSPLNLFLCFQDNICTYVLAEVSNTPWNERHYYLIDIANKKLINTKNFHVSPFWSIDQEYHWSFNIKEDNLFFQIDNYQNHKKVFSAAYSVNFVPLDKKTEVNQNLLRQPFSVWKIVFAIYFEAFKIFIKRIPFVPYQKRKDNH